jgi:hypothetical protein
MIVKLQNSNSYQTIDICVNLKSQRIFSVGKKFQFLLLKIVHLISNKQSIGNHIYIHASIFSELINTMKEIRILSKLLIVDDHNAMLIALSSR